MQPVHKIRVRYVVSGGPIAAGVIDFLTITQVAQMCGITSLTAITSTFLFNSFRLRKVEMWQSTVAGSLVTIAAKWADTPTAASVGIANPPQVVEDSSSEPDRPAHIVLKPQKGTWNENFFSAIGTPSYLGVTTSVAAGTATLDLHFSYVFDDLGPTPTGPALVGATIGTNYHKIVTGSAGLTYTPIAPLNTI